MSDQVRDVARRLIRIAHKLLPDDEKNVDAVAAELCVSVVCFSAAAEQTSLASQAKLIRKCALRARANWSDVASLGTCDYIADDLLRQITPAMLQAEEAALAAEKALEGEGGPENLLDDSRPLAP